MGNAVFVSIALFCGVAAAVGLFIRLQTERRRQLREQVRKMCRNMEALISSRNPAELRRIAALANRVRTLARVNKMELEQLGVTDRRLQSYVDRMHGQLVTLLKTTRPKAFAPSKSWRFDEDREGGRCEIIFDTSELDRLPARGPEGDLLCEILVEIAEDGTGAAASMEEILRGLTDGDIEGHIEANVERIRQPT